MTSDRLTQFVTPSPDSKQLGFLPKPLQRIADHCSRTDIPLVEWLSSLHKNDDGLCLRCQLNGAELFVWWEPESEQLCELERTADGTVLKPARAGPVRTAAALETADAVHLLPLKSTPASRTPTHR
jgi:hypothetical protein